MNLIKSFEYQTSHEHIDYFVYALTHLPLVPHVWVSESGQHWFR